MSHSWIVAQLSQWRLRLIAITILGVVLIPAAVSRIIDGDEGYLLQAARLVSEGNHPYVDFFFPMGPVVPYVYGAWFSLVGRGWVSARILTGLIAVAIGFLLFRYVDRKHGARWAFLALGLYVLSAGVLEWFSAVKTYGLAALFVLAAACALQHPSAVSTAAAGAFLVLAASTRLYVILALPCALLALRRDRRGVGFLLIGALVAAIPVGYVLGRDPVSAHFGILRFHGIRDAGNAGLVSNVPQKIEALLGVLSITPPAPAGGSRQYLPLLALALAGLRFSFVSYVWVGLFLVSFLPTPVHLQYFSLLLPFLIIDAIGFLATSSYKARLMAWALVLYAIVGIFEARHYLLTGLGLPGVMAGARVETWSIATMKVVTHLIDSQHIAVGASWWPGYFVETNTALHPDLASEFNATATARMTAAERSRFHFLGEEEITTMLAQRSPRLFVQGHLAPPGDLDGYDMVGQAGRIRVWVAR